MAKKREDRVLERAWAHGLGPRLLVHLGRVRFCFKHAISYRTDHEQSSAQRVTKTGASNPTTPVIPSGSSAAFTTSKSTSTFFDTPITNGPFDPAKYGKPKSARNVSTPARLLSHEHSYSNSGKATPASQGSEYVELTPRISSTSSKSARVTTTDSTTASKDFEKSSKVQNGVIAPHLAVKVSGTSQAQIQDRYKVTVEKSGVDADAVKAISPAFRLRLSHSYSPIPNPTVTFSSTSQALVVRSASVPARRTRPVTKGRPRINIYARSDLEVNEMSNSIQGSGFSSVAAAASLNESPHDKLKRLQQSAIIKHNVKMRRRHQDDTACSAILALIRQPLEPQVIAAVEYRVKHYAQIGTENIPPTAPVGIEPDWPKEELNRNQIRGQSIGDWDASAEVDKAVVLRKADPRWCTNAEVRAPVQRANSNAWGSGPSTSTEVEAGSRESLPGGENQHVTKVKCLRRLESPLVGWDGKMQPPPVDWADRPRFDNDSVDFHCAVNNWNEKLLNKMDREMHFNARDEESYSDPSYHADGLGFVCLNAEVNQRNAEHYGYTSEMMKEADECPLLSREPLSRADFEAVSTVAGNDPTTVRLLEETTEILVQRWIGQNGWLKDKVVPSRKLLAPPSHYQATMSTDTPEIRISLRPATLADIPGMTRIYNWYVENSSKTTEFETIPESDMRGRLDDVRGNKLPFIVAVARSRARGSARVANSYNPSARHDNRNGHPITNTNPGYRGLTEEENIIGWACASDLTAADYVERITSELELYVSPDYRQLGVGKALMDKLLESCDRGYMRVGRYDWRCADELQHLYSSGGGRDLHKLYFVIRKWSNPIKTLTHGVDPKKRKANGAASKVDDQEDEWDSWLGKWMESWGFEVEGMLKKVGAKKGRL